MYTHGVWRIIDSLNLKHVLVLLQTDGTWQLTHGTRDDLVPMPGIHRYYDIFLGPLTESEAVAAVEAYIQRMWVTDPEKVTVVASAGKQAPSLVVQQYFEIRSDKNSIIQEKLTLIESLHFGHVQLRDA